MTIEAVLFDLYGTLADIEVDEQTIAAWVPVAKLFEEWGTTPPPEDLRSRFHELCAEAAAVHGKGVILPEVFSRMLAEYGVPPDTAKVEAAAHLFRRASTVRLALRPYTRTLLATLRNQGLRLGLVSNTEAIFTREDLARLELEGDLDAIVLSSEVGREKPEPQILYFALNRLNVVPSVAVMVGDTWDTDIRAAQRAGMRAVYLDPTLPTGQVVSDGAVVRACPDETAILAAIGSLGIER